ncbi:MAG: hypothetical protein Q8S13_11940, partial [Dehalococcoidia bacterium]|nr:hypothetical protein [Dehalococcoidia bacterium]
GTSANRGLLFQATTHNIKKVSCITSGTPTTQHMVRLSQSADYEIAFNAIKFFGSYATATLWHGENSGSDADVTINATNGATPDGAEFENTASGTTTVNTSVTLKVTCKTEAGAALQDVQVAVYKVSDGTQLMNEATTAQGVAEEVVSVVAGTAVRIEARKAAGGANDYAPVSSPQTTSATGLDVTITMSEDPINEL